MGSPVVQDDFPALSSTADVCTRLSQLLTLWSRFGSFLGWLLNSDGDISDAVLEGVSDRTVPVGTVLMYASHSPPSDKWMTCGGQAISRATYSDLFSRIGTTYGIGNGTTTFQLPDLRARFPVGSGSIYTVGSFGGEAEHTLSLTEIPAHSHTVTGTFRAANTDSGGGALDAGSYSGTPTSITDDPLFMSLTIGNAGGGLSHNNIPPYMALAFLIKVK